MANPSARRQRRAGTPGTDRFFPGRDSWERQSGEQADDLDDADIFVEIKVSRFPHGSRTPGPARTAQSVRAENSLFCRFEGSGPSQPGFGSASIGVKARARGNPAFSPGEMRCGSVQDLRHPVVVDGHAADHQVLSLYHREALAREQPPGELAGLGEQARYSLLAGRRLHGVIQP
jgi:hypothetical protein